MEELKREYTDEDLKADVNYLATNTLTEDLAKEFIINLLSRKYLPIKQITLSFTFDARTKEEAFCKLIESIKNGDRPEFFKSEFP